MSEKCRICMIQSSINKFINITDKLNENSTILEAIVAISSIEAFQNDILPQVICKECYKNLVKCNDFRTQIICSDKVLKEELSNNSENHDTPEFTELLSSSNDANSRQTDSDKIEDKIDVKDHLINNEMKFESFYACIKYDESEEELYKYIHLEKKFECRFCNKKFVKKSHLADHVKLHKGETPFKYLHLEKKFECQICNEKFVNKRHLDDHAKLHKGERPFICELCGKSFSSPNYLQAHQKVHNSICRICQHKCTNSDELQIHIRQKHTEEKPYMCELCSHAFVSHSSLYRHKKEVHDEKVICPICNKPYGKKVLKSHIRKHTNKEAGINKKFNCSECDKVFTSATCRKRHMVVHSGEKPYKCNVCNKRFNQSGTLATHKRMHSEVKPFGCDICSKSFKYKHHFKLHFEKYHKGEELIV